MATLYTRTFNLKDSLSDEEVLEFWRHCMDVMVPAAESVSGTRSVKLYSGAGGLRADITFFWEMDDASVYERAIADPNINKHVGKYYGAWDMKTATQSFHREVTPELIQAIGGKV